MFMNKSANSIEKLFEKYIAMAEGEGTSFENPTYEPDQRINAIPSNCIVTKLDRQQMQGNDVMCL